MQLEQIDIARRMIARYPEALALYNRAVNQDGGLTLQQSLGRVDEIEGRLKRVMR